MLDELPPASEVELDLLEHQIEGWLTTTLEENHAAFYEHLLRRNLKTRLLWFCIGQEEAVFLIGQLPLPMVDEPNIDRVIGSVYLYVEQFFRPALRIGFASRFKG